MKNVLYNLLAKFSADTTDLDKSLQKSSALIEKLAQAALAAAGPAALTALTIASMKQIDADAKLADSLGISIKSLKSMTLVAGEAGVGVEALTGTLQIMQRNLYAAASAKGGQRDAVSQLGLNLQQLLNMAPDKQFEAIAAAISKIENPTLKVGLASEIFGRNARQLLNVFNDYGKAVDEATQFNQKWGLSLSRIDAAKVEQANDAFGRVKMTSQGLANVVAVELSPAITVMSEAITGADYSAVQFGDTLRFGMDEAALFFDFVKAGFTEVENTIAIAIQGVGTFLAKLDPTTSKADFQQMKSDLDDMISAANAPLSQNGFFDQLQKARDKADDAARNKVDNNAPIVASAKVAEDSLDKLREKWLDQQREMETFKNDAATTMSGFASSLFKGGNALDNFKAKALDVLGSIIDKMFYMSFGGTGSGGFLDTIAGGILNAFGGNAKVKSPIPKNAMGNVFQGGKITAFANGGVVNSKSLFPMSTGMGMMGEAGPEAIMPLSRGADGKLGVRGGGTTVVQNLNFSLGVQQTVRAEIQSMLPQISAAGIKAVQNGINRGQVRS